MYVHCVVGITYKYLGLRMFAHPWNDSDVQPGDAPSDQCGATEAFREIGRLNRVLVQHTEKLLRERVKDVVNECIHIYIHTYIVVLHTYMHSSYC